MSSRMTPLRSLARRGGREEQASALVEFALVSILFFTVVFGIMEYGRMILTYNVVSTAARLGGRYAAVRGSTSGHVATSDAIKTYVASKSLGILAASNVTVTWSPDNKPGSTVQVQTQKTFRPIVPLLPQTNLTLRSTYNMVIVH